MRPGASSQGGNQLKMPADVVLVHCGSNYTSWILLPQALVSNVVKDLRTEVFNQALTNSGMLPGTSSGGHTFTGTR